MVYKLIHLPHFTTVVGESQRAGVIGQLAAVNLDQYFFLQQGDRRHIILSCMALGKRWGKALHLSLQNYPQEALIKK